MIAKHLWKTVVLRKALIGHRVVSVNKIQNALVTSQHFLKQLDGFLLHGFFEERFQPRSGFQEIQQLHVEPLLDEVL